MTTTLGGLTARPARPTDARGIHALATRVGLAQGQPPVASLAEVEADLSWPGLDRERDTLLGTTSAGGVACSVIASVDKPGRVFVDILVDPALSDDLIDAVLDDIMGWSRARAFAECDRLQRPEVVLESAGMDGETRLFAAFTRAGLSCSRTYWRMERDLQRSHEPTHRETRWQPSASTIDAVDLDDDSVLRRVHLLREATFRDHHAQVPLSFAEYATAVRSAAGYDARSAWIARVDDADAGLLLANRSRAEEGLGWISTVGVLAPHRGQGLAQDLLGTAFDHFRSAGMRAVGLMVDAQNSTGALGLYRRAGMSVVEHVHTYELIVTVGW